MEHSVYQAYQRAQLEDESHHISHGYRFSRPSYTKWFFFGAPRSGKTATLRRLMRAREDLGDIIISSSSTGVAVTDDVVIKTPVSRLLVAAGLCIWKWKSKEGKENFSQLFYKPMSKYVNIPAQIRNEPAPSQARAHSDCLEQVAASDSLDTQDEPINLDCKRSYSNRLTDSEELEINDMFIKLATTLQSHNFDSEWDSDHPRFYDQSGWPATVKTMDVGGHPAFLDIIPALGLTSGPALFLIFFHLDQQLKQHYPVRFHANDSELETTLDTTYCNEDILFQSLATISNFSPPRRPSRYYYTSHNTLLLGTYEDKVDADQISTMRHAVKEMLMKIKLDETEVFIMNINLDSTHYATERVRRHLEDMLEVFPCIPIPELWFTFWMVLQLLNKPIVSLAQCEEIIKHLSIHIPLKEALWFFHHIVGSLMYYPDISSMEGMVICDPQIIFDCINTLIIDRISHNNQALSSHGINELYQNGQFTLSQVKEKMGQQNCPLTVNQLIDLLKYHNIFAEIKQDQDSSHLEPKFIMPAIMKVASDEELSALTAAISEDQAVEPIMIHFEGGFIPFGLFITTAAHLIAHQDSLSPKWQLCEEQVRRNMMKFTIDSAFYVTIIALPQYLQIRVSRHPQSMSKRSLPEICSTVRQTVAEALKTVISKMKYKPFGTLLPSSSEEPFDFAFTCCLEPSHNDHLMKIVQDKDGQYHAKCLKGGVLDNLEEKYRIWFGSSSSSAVPEDAPASTTDVSTLQHVIAQAGINSSDILDQECSQQVLLRLAKYCVDWQLIGFYLELTKADIVAVDGDYQSVDEKRIGMLGRWKDKFAFKATYRVFIEALLSCEKVSDAIEACKAVTSTTIDLQGVEVLQKTTVTVTNSECTFVWEGYGLKFHIPENSLPSDMKEITLTIIASIAGHYKFPENSSLFSGIYWFSYEPLNVKLQLKKPVKLEIQHCSKPDCTSSLSFVRASNNLEKLPYTFKCLKGGDFTSCSSYGTLEVNKFCGICIAGESGAKRYLASVFYLRHETAYRNISIAVTLDDDAHRRASERKFSKAADDEVSIDFESDEITLDIPQLEDALEIEGWKLYPTTYLMVKKEMVDNSLPDQIPYCRILADIVDPGRARETPLYHRVNLRGAKAPSNYINIFLSVGDEGGGSAHGSSGAASAANTTSDNPLTLDKILKILLSLSQHWENIGTMLSLSEGCLAAIKIRCSDVPGNCLREMLTEWLKQDNPPPTKSALVKAVKIFNSSLAEKISAL